MTFNAILEHFMTGAITFTTVEDCKDISECIDHLRLHHPDHDIQQIKEVK